MSKARDISNLFSASTAAATDAEVTSSIATHASNTTNRHYRTGTTANRPESPNVGDLYFDTTLDRLIEYRSTGWRQVSEVPNAPTNVVATGTTTNASISFTAPTNVPVISYTVTSSPGSFTATGTSSPLSISGLTPGTSYTFSVVAQGYNGNSQPGVSNSITAALPTVSGGTLYSDATYYYRKFTSSDNLLISGSVNFDILCIAGGGGGGRNKAGGGGAGRIVYATNQNLSGTIALTVGAGGSRETSAALATNGSDSTVGAVITSIGGGRGGNEGSAGGSGGSGGGGGRFGAGGTVPSYTGVGTAYGNAGASGQGDSSPYRGGGGGGSGGAGTSGGGGGHGGAGNNTWSSWATITSSGVSGFYAGGGGGGAYGGSAGNAGSGGAGSGTNHSGINDNGGIGGSATANTGSGGGGGGNVSDGGLGGSGIIMVRYLKTDVAP